MDVIGQADCLVVNVHTANQLKERGELQPGEAGLPSFYNCKNQVSL
jgi:hypothetical protein